MDPKELLRGMRNAEMRSEFPDPDQRKAALRRRSATSLAKSTFDDLVDCCKGVGDVPEVQAIIDLIQPSIESWWRETMGLAVEDAVDRFMRLEDRIPGSRPDSLMASETQQRDEALLVAAFLSVLTRGSQAPLPARVDALLTRAADRVLRAGGATTGGLDLSQEPLLRSAAKDDLRALLAGRISTREADVRRAAQDFLRNARARVAARPGDITESLRGGARSLQEWLTGVTDLAGINTSTWLPQAVDQWAYRWFNVGAYRGARQRGVTEFVAFAVRDTRTTPFCRWVHGRTVSVRRMDAQLDRHIRLSTQGDIEGMAANWPMLPSSIVRGTPRDFRKGFARVGIPPYHFFCRTRIRPA